MKFFKNLGKILKRTLLSIAIFSFSIGGIPLFFYVGLRDDLVSLSTFLLLGLVVYIWYFYHMLKNDIENAMKENIFPSLLAIMEYIFHIFPPLLIVDTFFYLAGLLMLGTKLTGSPLPGIIGAFSVLIVGSFLIWTVKN